MKEISINKGNWMEHTIGCTTRPYASISFAEACEHIAEAGYSDVAVFGNTGSVAISSNSSRQDIGNVRRVAERVGLVPSLLIGGTQLDLGLEAAVEDYRRLIGNTASLGASWLLDCGTSNTAHYDDYYALMQETSPYAEACGITITLKPHGGITLTVQDLINAYNRVNRSGFGICYDPGNIIYYTKGEHQPGTNLDLLAPKISNLIIKDCILDNGNPDVMVTPGKGLVDFREVIAILQKSGFQGPMYLECVGGESLDEINHNVKSTLDFLRDLTVENQ